MSVPTRRCFAGQRAERAGALLLALVVALWALGAAWFQEGGFLDQESLHFLQHYLSERELVPKLLDVRIADWGWYQARELSYFVDWLDAQFIFASLRAGIVHFYPLSHSLACGAIALLHWRQGRRHFGALTPLSRVLLAALFLSSSHSIFSTYYRSAKDLVAIALYSLLWLAFAGPGLLRGGSEPEPRAPAALRLRWPRAAAILALSLAMAASDRQGLFFLGALLAVALLLAALERSAQRLALAVVFAAACFVSELNNRWLTPALIRATNHYDPPLEHQSLGFLARPLASLVSGEGLGAAVESTSLIAGLTSHCFGSLGCASGWLVLLALAAILWRGVPSRERAAPPRFAERLFAARFGIVFLAAVAMLCALSWAMAQKEPFLTQPESAIVYYWAPANALLFFATSAAVQLLLSHRAALRPWIHAALLASIAANLFALPRLREVVLSAESSWTGHERAAELRACLRTRDVDAQGFALHPREAGLCRFLLRRVDPRFSGAPRDAAADHALGLQYLEGRDLLLDPAESLAWLQRAARAGHAPAQRSLATLDFRPFLRPGARARPPDAAARLAWLREAAQQRDLAAQCALAVAYHEGRGAPRDAAQARFWAESCAQLGRERGQQLRRTLRSLESAGDRAILRELLQERAAAPEP